MIKLIDFSSWKEYDGISEGSGRSEKIWLQSNDGNIGLFKFPKINPADNKETTEHISEHLAYKLGEVVGISTAKVDIGTYNGRLGSMSHFVCDENEILSEGIWCISASYPKYNSDNMIDEESETYYCLEHLKNSVPKILPSKVWIEMLMFDFLIGNRDRHQSNWAILIKIADSSVQMRWCPLYDNGSSLCCYKQESEIPALLGKDKNRFEALADSKSRSLIRLDGSKKALPTHREVVGFLLKNYSVSREIANRFLEKLSSETIENLLKEYPDTLLSEQKRGLIYKFLCRKCEILRKLSEEVE